MVATVGCRRLSSQCTNNDSVPQESKEEQSKNQYSIYNEEKLFKT